MDVNNVHVKSILLFDHSIAKNLYTYCVDFKSHVAEIMCMLIKSTKLNGYFKSFKDANYMAFIL